MARARPGPSRHPLQCTRTGPPPRGACAQGAARTPRPRPCKKSTARGIRAVPSAAPNHPAAGLEYFSLLPINKEPNRDDFEAGIREKPKKETLHDFEAGIERKTKNQILSATAYYMRYKDQLVLTGKINDVGAYTRSNIPNSYRLGIEIEGSSTITKWLKLQANISISKNKILDFTDYYDDYDLGGQKTNFYPKANISFSPSIVGSSSIIFNLYEGIQGSINSKYVRRQFLDNTSREDRSLKPYFLQDLQINYQIKTKYLKTAELILQINNIHSIESIIKSC